MPTLRLIRAVGVCGAVVAASGCATTAVLEQELTKTNTQTVLAFEETVFNKHEVPLAFDHYVGPTFVEHFPRLIVDRELAERDYQRLVTQRFRDWRVTIVRTIAQRDFVAAQGSWERADGRGQTVPIVDIYRLQQGHIIEHWAVVQAGSPFEDGEPGPAR